MNQNFAILGMFDRNSIMSVDRSTAAYIQIYCGCRQFRSKTLMRSFMKKNVLSKEKEILK